MFVCSFSLVDISAHTELFGLPWFQRSTDFLYSFVKLLMMTKTLRGVSFPQILLKCNGKPNATLLFVFLWAPLARAQMPKTTCSYLNREIMLNKTHGKRSVLPFPTVCTLLHHFVGQKAHLSSPCCRFDFPLPRHREPFVMRPTRKHTHTHKFSFSMINVFQWLFNTHSRSDWRRHIRRLGYISQGSLD